jgi:hypothetical protein
MLFGRAFRAQLVVQGQRELYDYWLQSAGERLLPARSHFDPLKVPRLLPHIGLIDLRDGVDEGSFKLAGTCLREIYGQELTGRRLSDIYRGDSAPYWRRVHGRIAETGAPGHGVVHGPLVGRDHVVLFWLRLPLSDDGCHVDRILCLDIAGPYETVEVQTAPTPHCYPRVLPELVPRVEWA